ncbi:hypothetical protein ISF_05949 [Cordyceps fumosorosea ARSEF 2679]|uniref:Uncharacterized protein n=1 Tax=Cordyceps fumosorosea (strain ARSEF 2679) TaxID=1081104 RepID=A0A167SUK3_CORFA|nr:hypothetical protein ISF_05949 [Cordyceps fumosorosea ARSEF 2679]OAA59938.1 hypothetical protein ISF_05949 [Cordyceps fumosorosea ARSEF 2679]
MLFNWATWLGALCLLCVQVLAGGVPGGLERAHLWEAYELAWLWKGKDQSYLFPDVKTHKKLGATPNPPGTEADGKFTFQEFIQNMDKKVCSIEGPSDSRDMMTVAKELDGAGFNKDVQGMRFNRGLESLKKKTGKSYYFLLHEMVAKMVEDMAADKDFTKKRAGDAALDEKVKAKLDRMKGATKMIESIRTDDFGDWLKKDLTRSRTATSPNPVKGRPDLPNPGFGLDEADVKTDTITNEFDGEKYERVNVDETVKGLKKDLRKDFRSYVANYGRDKFPKDGPKAPSVDYTDAAKTHFQTLELWKAVKVRFTAC